MWLSRGEGEEMGKRQGREGNGREERRKGERVGKGGEEKNKKLEGLN